MGSLLISTIFKGEQIQKKLSDLCEATPLRREGLEDLQSPSSSETGDLARPHLQPRPVGGWETRTTHPCTVALGLSKSSLTGGKTVVEVAGRLILLPSRNTEFFYSLKSCLFLSQGPSL